MKRILIFSVLALESILRKDALTSTALSPTCARRTSDSLVLCLESLSRSADGSKRHALHRKNVIVGKTTDSVKKKGTPDPIV